MAEIAGTLSLDGLASDPVVHADAARLVRIVQLLLLAYAPGADRLAIFGACARTEPDPWRAFVVMRLDDIELILSPTTAWRLAAVVKASALIPGAADVALQFTQAAEEANRLLARHNPEETA